VGRTVIIIEGLAVGLLVGLFVGLFVGLLVGLFVGRGTGFFIGLFVGRVTGTADVDGVIVTDGRKIGDEDCDGTGDVNGTDDGSALSISLHEPHFKSFRTLGYMIHVSLQSLVPAVPLCINQPWLKSKHPSGIGLQSPARSDGN
jgi:hypothetical protein